MGGNHMKQTRRIFAMAIAGMLALSSLGVAANAGGGGGVAVKKVAITEYNTENGVLTVKAENKGEAKSILVMVLEKTDVQSNDQSDITYGIRDAEVAAGATATFTVAIPDSKNGKSASGAYIIKVQDGSENADAETFMYAVPADITAFVESVKGATAGDRLTLFTNPANKAVLVTIGLDYDAFVGADPTVQQNAVDTLYNNGVASLTKDNFSDAFLSAFGLAVYNTGDKAAGLAALSPKYDGQAADATKLAQVQSKMQPSYLTTAEFVADFALQYGLITVNNAAVSNMGDVLSAFSRATGKCTAVIGNILGLGPIPMRTAAEYIVPALNNSPATTETELNAVLGAAYSAALGGGQGGGGGSTGGGGGFGSVGNTKDNQPSSVGSATGSGTYEEQVGTTKIFGDLASTHWAATSVKYLKNKGVVSGTDAGNFEPDRAVTREEFAKMLVVACGINTDGKSADFADMEENAWYLPYIGAAVEAGIVNGVGDNIFGVGQQISRQDMAVMVKRAMEATNMSLDTFRVYTEFADSDAIKDYAKDAVKALFEAKILNGKGENNFDPMGIATRAEAAKIIYETIQ